MFEAEIAKLDPISRRALDDLAFLIVRLSGDDLFADPGVDDPSVPGGKLRDGVYGHVWLYLESLLIATCSASTIFCPHRESPMEPAERAFKRIMQGPHTRRPEDSLVYPAVVWEAIEREGEIVEGVRRSAEEQRGRVTRRGGMVGWLGDRIFRLGLALEYKYGDGP